MSHCCMSQPATTGFADAFALILPRRIMLSLHDQHLLLLLLLLRALEHDSSTIYQSTVHVLTISLFHAWLSLASNWSLPIARRRGPARPTTRSQRRVNLHVPRASATLTVPSVLLLLRASTNNWRSHDPSGQGLLVLQTRLLLS